MRIENEFSCALAWHAHATALFFIISEALSVRQTQLTNWEHHHSEAYMEQTPQWKRKAKDE